MVTYNYIETTTDQHYGAGFPVIGQDKFFILERTFNATTALTDMSISAWVAEDVVKLIDIPAKTFVYGLNVYIDTASTSGSGTTTLDIGDGDDPNGWEDNIASATVDTHIFSMTNANGGTVTDRNNGYYKTADTIDAVLADQIWTAGVFTIRVICIDLS